MISSKCFARQLNTQSNHTKIASFNEIRVEEKRQIKSPNDICGAFSHCFFFQLKKIRPTFFQLN